MLIRSKLFVPGSRPELFEEAAGSAADAISLDLEDAVDVINLPKVESASGVRAAIEAIAHAEDACVLDRKIPILANVETPRGLRLAAEIATADPRVIGLQIGFADLLLPLGIDRRDSNALQFIRMAVRLAAGEAGIAAYDAAFPDIKSPEFCRAEAEAARRLGYEGKSCIHPSQIAIANEVFVPRVGELEHAEKVLTAARDAAEHRVQAFVVNGQLIDAPMIEHARAVAALGVLRVLNAL